MDAIVLAGGKGTRLRSIVSDRPKPMAEAAGRPFLEWLLLHLRAQGLRRVILATGYKGEQIQAYFGNGARWGLELRFAHESVPLGTGGAARHALEQVETDRVVVLNGDSFCRVDIAHLADAHQRAGARATLWLIPMDDCRRYGMVTIERSGRVVAFQEKAVESRSGLISAGVYLFDRSVLASIAPRRAASLETDVFPALIGRGLHAVVGEGPFLDIGTPESYGAAQQFIVENRSLWQVDS